MRKGPAFRKANYPSNRHILSMSLAIIGVTAVALNSAAADAKTPTQVAKKSQVSSKPGRKSHPLLPALRIAKSSRQSLNDVNDYEADFSKRELVGDEIISQSMRMKIRHQPFSVYLGFTNKQNAGREVIYVDGKHDGKLLAHETGFKSLVGTVSLLPGGPDVMEENRYPVNMIGMSNMLDQVIEQWEAEQQHGEIDVKYYPQAKLGDVACKVIETSHPQPRRQFKFHMTRLYIDKNTNFPIRIEQFGFPEQSEESPPLFEEYTYTNVKANVDLTDVDFDTENPNYGF